MLIFLFSLYCSFHGIGQEASSKIDSIDLRAFVDTLSSSQFEGRGVDNDGQIKTQEFIVDKFKALRLKPFFGDGFLEKFFLHQTDRGKLYVETHNHRLLQNLDQMVYEGAIHHNKTMEREVVFGGYGTEKELNRIAVENRFVMILSRNQEDEFFIKKRLEERDASGLVVFYKDDKSFEAIQLRLHDFYAQKKYEIVERHANTNALFPQLAETVNAFPAICSIKLSGEEVKNVMGLSKSKLVSLASKGKNHHVPPTVMTIHFEQVEKTIETANVIGFVKGEKDTSIVVSAHYDHVGREGNQFFPGADDNASGVAALLELAEEFAQYKHLKYSMIFMATTAEEGGLLGSLYHTEQPDFDPRKIVCNVNIDMISRCDDSHDDCAYLYCIGNDQSEMLDSLVRKADSRFQACSFDYSGNDSDIFYRTDGYNFKKKGVPSILFFAGFHDDYHKPTDTIEKIDFDLLESRTKLICEVIKLIQREL